MKGKAYGRINYPPQANQRLSQILARNFWIKTFLNCAPASTDHNGIMAGVKRKSAAPIQSENKAKSKKLKVDKSSSKRPVKSATVREKPSKKAKITEESDELIESDTSEEDNGFYGFSANEEEALSGSEDDYSGESSEPERTTKQLSKASLRKNTEGKTLKSDKKSSSQQVDKEKASGLAAVNGRLYFLHRCTFV